jgi:hypothetical protein
MCSWCVAWWRHLPSGWLDLQAFFGVSFLLKALQTPRLVLRKGIYTILYVQYLNYKGNRARKGAKGSLGCRDMRMLRMSYYCIACGSRKITEST